MRKIDRPSLPSPDASLQVTTELIDIQRERRENWNNRSCPSLSDQNGQKQNNLLDNERIRCPFAPSRELSFLSDPGQIQNSSTRFHSSFVTSPKNLKTSTFVLESGSFCLPRNVDWAPPTKLIGAHCSKGSASSSFSALIGGGSQKRELD